MIHLKKCFVENVKNLRSLWTAISAKMTYQQAFHIHFQKPVKSYSSRSSKIITISSSVVNHFWGINFTNSNINIYEGSNVEIFSSMFL